MRHGNLDEADRLLRDALQLDPANPEIHEVLGSLLDRRGDVEGAVASFRTSVRLGGNAVILASYLAKIGRLDEAEDAIVPVRGSPPETADYWSLEGNLAFAKQDWLRAADLFEKAERLGAPVHLSAYNRGLALVRGGRPEEARPHLLRALETEDPALRESAANCLALIEP
jgi:Flp pilus assembly protein TadD